MTTVGLWPGQAWTGLDGLDGLDGITADTGIREGRTRRAGRLPSDAPAPRRERQQRPHLGEVASCADVVHVRHSKDLTVPSFSAFPAVWGAFPTLV
ncbi:hypothetical protein ACFWVF_16490 [Streptomyces sp. NPDC058659]|uniref:hypothetical protein n=1 Tax=Streptomyces sp. NPDC058659 TaxID=3346581 RepID=UPI003657A7C2